MKKKRKTARSSREVLGVVRQPGAREEMLFSFSAFQGSTK